MGEDFVIYLTIICDLTISVGPNVCLLFADDPNPNPTKDKVCAIRGCVEFFVPIGFFIIALLVFFITFFCYGGKIPAIQHSSTENTASSICNKKPLTAWCRRGIKALFSRGKEKGPKRHKWIAGLLYLLGDNAPDLAADTAYYRQIESISLALLLLAATIYMLPLRSKIEEQFKKLRNEKDEKEKEKEMKYDELPESYQCYKQLLPIFVFLQHLPKGDTFATALTLAAGVSNTTCETLYEPFEEGTWIYYGSIPILTFVVILYILIRHWWKHDWFSYGDKRCGRKCRNKCCCSQDCGLRCVVAIFQIAAAFLVGIVILAYILADNEYPLECVAPSKIFEAFIRLILYGFVIVVFGSIALSNLCYYFIKRFSPTKRRPIPIPSPTPIRPPSDTIAAHAVVQTAGVQTAGAQTAVQTTGVVVQTAGVVVQTAGIQTAGAGIQTAGVQTAVVHTA